MNTTISHHLDPATLVAFAAGSLEAPLAAVSAAHIEMCLHCQRELGDLELLGSALLADLDVGADESPMSVLPRRPVSSATWTLPPRTATSRDRDAGPVLFAQQFGLDLNNIVWRWLGPGIRHCRLPLPAGIKGDLRLLKIEPGKQMPEHGHGGTELTLVLEGMYRDQSGTYRRGDVQDIDDESEHRPMADEVTGCVCIIASERPARFKGLTSRLLQPLTGM